MSNQQRSLFSSPLEASLRAAFLLNAIAPKQVDLQRIVFYDYLLVHSGDITGGPSSLQPDLPYRGSEWLARKQIFDEGLGLLVARELANKYFNNNGICFSASPLTNTFLKYFKSEYAGELAKRSIWIREQFQFMSNEELEKFMLGHLSQWGAEYSSRSRGEQ